MILNELRVPVVLAPLGFQTPGIYPNPPVRLVIRVPGSEEPGDAVTTILLMSNTVADVSKAVMGQIDHRGFESLPFNAEKTALAGGSSPGSSGPSSASTRSRGRAPAVIDPSPVEARLDEERASAMC